MLFKNHHNHFIHRKKEQVIGVSELIGIALEGMVGGGTRSVYAQRNYATLMMT